MWDAEATTTRTRPIRLALQAKLAPAVALVKRATLAALAKLATAQLVSRRRALLASSRRAARAAKAATLPAALAAMLRAALAATSVKTAVLRQPARPARQPDLPSFFGRCVRAEPRNNHFADATARRVPDLARRRVLSVPGERARLLHLIMIGILRVNVSRWATLVGGGVAVLTTACAGRFDPANFEGTREARRAEPEALLDLVARTDELETLGTVHDSCMLRPGFRRLEREALSDVDCSNERLLIALHESAANAGGEALLGAQCRSNRLGATALETYELSCAAEVARFRSGASANLRPLSAPRSVVQGTPAPSARDVQRIDEPDASLAFRISLNFEPAVSSFERPVLRAADVHELSQMPLSHRRLGDLAARCKDGCDERALRYGVLIAAGRLGVPDVVGVRCFRSARGDSCVGTLAAPERDE